MAYVEGQWVSREEREERMRLLSRRIKKLVKLHKAGLASEYHIETLLSDKEELKKLKAVHRGEFDVAYFSFEFLSDELNPENDDNIIRNGDDGSKHQPLVEMAPIHREFFDLTDEINENKGTNLAIAAPRGHSKSGIFSNAFILHQLVYRRQIYTLVVSETDSLSKKLVSWTNKQLKYNKKLRDHFGELMSPSATKNEKDNEEAFVTQTGALVEASSSGKQLRGKRWGAHRPSLVLIDDPSSSNNEGTMEARTKLIEWFNSVVVPIGSKTTSIVLVGTMVSSTGLLKHVLDRKDFRSSFHDAIVQEPDNPDLWEEYLQVYSRAEDLEEPNEFYEKYKAQLEAGCETAWEWRWTYRDLMHARVNMGSKSFNSEFRNRAYSEDERFFPGQEDLAFYHYKPNEYGERVIIFEDQEYKLSDMTISGSWDIAMGKNSRSCYNSAVTVGRHEKSGYIFVLDEYATREQPHKFIDKIITRIKTFRHHTFAVETINAQHEFYRQLQERLRAEGLYTTKVLDIKSHSAKKEQRIESLEPYMANRTLVFNRSHKILLDQVEQYPNGDYVDSLDSLVMSVEKVARAKKKVLSKPFWL
jgi:predicted phage terminase large subunit-like protein